jgi:hypothetical protein
VVFALLVGSVAGLGGRAEAQTAGDNQPPVVTFFVNGERVGRLPLVGSVPGVVPRFRMGQPLQFEASAADADGLGFPIFAFAGVSTPISYLWDFGGGTSSPLGVFAERPVVSFDLAPGEQAKNFRVALTVFDTTGLSRTSEGLITIDRSGPPAAQLVIDDIVLPQSPVVFRIPRVGPQVRLGVVAFDESGLGFPIFAPFGQTAAVSYLWNFGGGQPANPLDVFSPSPTVTFPVGPGSQFVDFLVSVTVFDATGESTTRSVILAIFP